MRTAIPAFVLLLCFFTSFPIVGARHDDSAKKSAIPLGNFSISLTVKDVQASKEFYEKLGFKMSGGDIKRKYVIMQNETSTVGLYQGMFEKNSLTYNPGWDRDCKTLTEYQDVREIQKELKSRGLSLSVSADESTTGPAFIVLSDPDGNPILIDQHVAKPSK
ncbi:MAG: hypothetical protein U0930_06720 [Pirellulales bacterium]